MRRRSGLTLKARFEGLGSSLLAHEAVAWAGDALFENAVPRAQRLVVGSGAAGYVLDLTVQ
jgi:hypothetical protein